MRPNARTSLPLDDPLAYRLRQMRFTSQPMPASVVDMEKQALGLSPEQRAHLADKLLSSLSPDPGIEEAWSAEAIRRLEEMENGSVTGIPVEAAIARAKTGLSYRVGAV